MYFNETNSLKWHRLPQCIICLFVAGHNQLGFYSHRTFNIGCCPPQNWEIAVKVKDQKRLSWWDFVLEWESYLDEIPPCSRAFLYFPLGTTLRLSSVRNNTRFTADIVVVTAGAKSLHEVWSWFPSFGTYARCLWLKLLKCIISQPNFTSKLIHVTSHWKGGGAKGFD